MRDPKAGQTPLSDLLETRTFLPEDFAFGSQAGFGVRPEALLKLAHELSVTTVEDLYGLALVADPVRLHMVVKEGFIKTGHATLPESLRPKLRDETLQAFATVAKLRFTFGARLESRTVPPSESTVSALRESAPTSLQPEVSLLNDCVPTIRHQHDRPTCVAFATAAVIEYAYCRRKSRRLDLSEQWQYWNCKRHDGDPLGGGTSPQWSFYLAARDGLCEEPAWPYQPNDNPANPSYDPPPPSAMSAPRHRIANYAEAPVAGDVAAIKRWLAADQAVAFAIPVFDSWDYNPNTRLTGNILMPLPGEKPQPMGHAMALFGYEDNDQYAGGGYFIVRNSWGSDWGSQSPFGPGYGTIPYRFIELHNYGSFTGEV